MFFFGKKRLITKLSEGDMVVSDAKYHLSCLTSLYLQEKKINRTYCDETADEQIMKDHLFLVFVTPFPLNSKYQL